MTDERLQFFVDWLKGSWPDGTPHVPEGVESWTKELVGEILRLREQLAADVSLADDATISVGTPGDAECQKDCPAVAELRAQRRALARAACALDLGDDDAAYSALHELTAAYGAQWHAWAQIQPELERLRNESDEMTQALNEIAKICDGGEWECASQVVRMVRELYEYARSE